MIDPEKCEFEESYDDADFGCTVYYFTYPTDWNEIRFCPEGEYISEYGSRVFCMCVSLSVYGDDSVNLAMSPTVETGDSLSDVDWRDLEYGVNYTDETVGKLLQKTKV